MRRYAALPFIAAAVFTGAVAWVVYSIDKAVHSVGDCERRAT